MDQPTRPAARRTTPHHLLVLAIAGASAAALLNGCGSSDGAGETGAGDTGGGGASTAGNGGGTGGQGFSMPDLVSIAIDPPSATLTSINGSKPEQIFQVIGTFTNGTTRPLSGATFSLDKVAMGDINGGSGAFAANGLIGGSAIVSAVLPDGSSAATATLTVKLETTLVVGDTPMDADTHFASVLVSDAARAPGVVYPLQGALMPQNVYPADIQWTNGAAGDVFRITLQKPDITARAYVLHTGAGFKNDWLVDAQVWRSLAQTDPDAPATITVDRWESATGETVASGAPVSMTFAKAALTGSVYYWDINAGRIKRINDGAGTAESFMPRPPTALRDDVCVGCHSVSNSGRYMAGRLGGGDNIGGVFDLTQDLTVAPAPTIYPLSDTSLRWWFSSWSPDDTRLVVSTSQGGPLTMKFYDPFTGVEVPVQGTLPTLTSQPAWSPDGLSIAYVANTRDWGGNITAGDIAVLPVTGPDQIGEPTVIHQATALADATPGGTADSYPTWTPDSKRIAFAHGTGARSDLPNGKSSALYMMNADGSNVVRLDAAVGGASTIDDFQPRFSPFDSGGYYWMSFLSRRDYGNAAAGTQGTKRQQIWVTAVKKNPAPGEDPTAVSYWLPGQNTASKNISAFWAPRACRQDGDACSVGTECCGGDCRPNADGALVCTPPPPERCRALNETCSTSADCCDGRTCTGNVCTDPQPL